MEIKQEHVGKYFADGEFFENKNHYEYVFEFNEKQLSKGMYLSFGPIMTCLILVISYAVFFNISIGIFKFLLFGAFVFIVSWMLFSSFYFTKKYQSITLEEGLKKMSVKVVN